MERKENDKILMMCGGSIILLTLLIYLIGCRSIWDLPICWFSLAFVVLSEILLVISIMNTKVTPLRLGIITTNILYFVITVVLAFVFLKFFLAKFTVYVLSNVALIVIAFNINLCLKVFMKYSENKVKKF